MRLLLLAGSGEAGMIAAKLAMMKDVSTIASLAGTTRQPIELGFPTRVGGFGGDEGFRKHLRDKQIDAVLDATHPFAARISNRTAAICAELDIPYAMVLRDEWIPGPGDNWVFFDNETEVADIVPKGATVFLGTGPQGLPKFANLTGRRVICRRVDPPKYPFPFEGGEYLVGRPPFSFEDEVALFQKLGVSVLVVKNSGGTPSRSKLDAARHLSIKVALLRRPAPPDALIVRDVDAALDWVRALI